MDARQSGILCHVTSLPSRFGIGDLGPSAYEFIDFLHETKQTIWQILPLTPTNLLADCSPYSSPSAFAGNRYLISPELLVEDGLLEKKDIERAPAFSPHKVEFKRSIDYKAKLYAKLIKRFDTQDLGYQSFIEENKYWLDDYACFRLLKRQHGKNYWNKWPQGFRRREAAAMWQFIKENDAALKEFTILQFVFFKQWSKLKSYCHQKQVQILGDIPIYVHLDSVDVWCSPKNFKLDKNFVPRFVAGAPPDAFSVDGQRWGNPVYDWTQMQQDGFDWWIKRVSFNLKLYDWARIDHFRGLINYWEIPNREKTARKGAWIDVPTEEFLKALRDVHPELPVIAEDLGIMTDDVREKINNTGIPGMKILQFAFDSDTHTNPYLPHNFGENCVVYTGTHDNNTTLGWFKGLADWQRRNVLDYLGRFLGGHHGIRTEEIHWYLMELAARSRAHWAIFSLQDVLGCDETGRMNIPGTKKGNWSWRFRIEDLTPNIKEKLTRLTQTSQRA